MLCAGVLAVMPGHPAHFLREWCHGIHNPYVDDEIAGIDDDSNREKHSIASTMPITFYAPVNLTQNAYAQNRTWNAIKSWVRLTEPGNVVLFRRWQRCLPMASGKQPRHRTLHCARVHAPSDSLTRHILLDALGSTASYNGEVVPCQLGHHATLWLCARNRRRV